MNNADKVYLELVEDILVNGSFKGDRTGTGTYSVFGRQMRFDLSETFPLLTTKKVAFRSVLSELLWFIKGDTNIRFLIENKNRIWNEWPFQKWVQSDEYDGPDMTDFARRAEKDEAFAKQYKEQMDKFIGRILTDHEFNAKYGDIGSGAYGAQWRSFPGPDGESVDQLKDVIEMIKDIPDSRRHLVSAWNPAEIKAGNAMLPPCHVLFQFYVADGKLSCQLYQRSGDVFLGIPFNIASYSLLTLMIAKECGLEAGEFVHTIGDAHIYSNHVEQCKLQLSRKVDARELPAVELSDDKQSIFDYGMEDVKLVGYDPHPKITAPVAV